MIKIILTVILLFSCQQASADMILLKNGEIIEGKIIQVRDIFVRVLGNNDTPFTEFLIENIINIEQSSPDEISQLSIRNIHQRAINRANSAKIQEAVNRRATKLLEEAIEGVEGITFEKASDEVKTVVRKKASAIIEEAVLSAEAPRLNEVPEDVKNIAEEKAGSVIEQAVRIVEVFPLQKAPDGVQIAAKQAAVMIVGEAVIDERKKESEKKSASSIKDFVIGGLVVFLLFFLFQVRGKNKKDNANGSGKVLESSLKEIDEELKKFDQTSGNDEILEVKENSWAEKREHKRVLWNFPIALSHDENEPIFAMVKDISLGGAFAVSNDISLLRTLGDRSQFKFNFASNDPNFPIHGMAEVVRIKSNRGLGLKFFDLDQRSIGYLNSLG